MRKLSRHERFIGPAAAAAEVGLEVDALVGAVGAALSFDDPADAQSVELQKLLRSTEAAELTGILTGLDAEHPLFSAVRSQIAARQATLAA